VNLPDIVPLLVGVVIGGVITWLVSRHYYKKAGDELKREATELRRLTNLVLHGLEDAGSVKLNRDTSGKVIGLIIEASAKATGVGLAPAEGEVIQGESSDRNSGEASGANSSNGLG
jgi:hypothetical protein